MRCNLKSYLPKTVRVHPLCRDFYSLVPPIFDLPRICFPNLLSAQSQNTTNLNKRTGIGNITIEMHPNIVPVHCGPSLSYIATISSSQPPGPQTIRKQRKTSRKTTPQNSTRRNSTCPPPHLIVKIDQIIRHPQPDRHGGHRKRQTRQCGDDPRDRWEGGCPCPPEEGDGENTCRGHDGIHSGFGVRVGAVEAVDEGDEWEIDYDADGEGKEGEIGD